MTSRHIALWIATTLLYFGAVRAAAAEVRVYPAPAGVALSDAFTVSIDGNSSPVYRALVAPEDDKKRSQAMDDAAHSAELFDVAGYSTFDIAGPATITVTCPAEVKSVKVLPTALGITPTIAGKTITIRVTNPGNLTIEVNGDWCRSLHLFANPIETNVPTPGDPNVIYFGPGVHDVTGEGIVAGNGQTIYLAGGAILRATGGGKPVVQLHGNHVTLRGRGIIDGTGAPTHTRSLLSVQGSDITVEGVIFHDSAGWTMPVRRSERVTIENVKLFSHRSNSDGIDLCNCQDVTVDGCFVRTLDDCIVVKADTAQGPVKHIIVKRCVLWNQLAHALSIGAELREPVDDVLFSDCDVIHDTGREWTLRIFHCDATPVTHIRFEHIRVEESHRLISVWIGKAIWSKDSERGRITGVVFNDITAIGNPLTVSLQGYDISHLVQDVRFDRVTINGQPLSMQNVKKNADVRDVKISP